MDFQKQLEELVRKNILEYVSPELESLKTELELIKSNTSLTDSFELLSRTAAAKLLDINPNTLSIYVHQGLLKCIRTSDKGKMQFRKKDLLSYIESKVGGNQ